MRRRVLPLLAFLAAVPAWSAGAGSPAGEREPPAPVRPALAENRTPASRNAARPGAAELLRRLGAVAAQGNLLDRAPLAAALELRFVPANDGQRGEAGWLAAWNARVTWSAGRDGSGGAARAALRVQLGPAADCVPPEAVAATFGRNWHPRYGPDAPPSLPRMEYRLRHRPAPFPGVPAEQTVLQVAFRAGPCATEFRFADGSVRAAD